MYQKPNMILRELGTTESCCSGVVLNQPVYDPLTGEPIFNVNTCDIS